MRYRAKRDIGESLIVAMLRGAGAAVYRLDGKNLPDLLVFHRGQTLLLEVKQPPGPRGGTSDDGQHLSPGQEAFRAMAMSRGVTVYAVTTPEEALAALGLHVVHTAGTPG